jgi:hypothetical protein
MSGRTLVNKKVSSRQYKFWQILLKVRLVMGFERVVR